MQRHTDTKTVPQNDDMFTIPTKQDVMDALMTVGPENDIPAEWVLDKCADREGTAS